MAAERSSFHNGIWLCQSCAKLIDSDTAVFTVQLLKNWKEQAEMKALEGVGATKLDNLPQPPSAKHTPLPRIRWLPYSLARMQLIEHGWHPNARHWSDGESPDIQHGNGPHYWDLGFREIVQANPTGLAACVFRFTDAYGYTLDIVTEGEVIPESGQEAMVTSWHIRDVDSSIDATMYAEVSRPAITVARPITPSNLFESIQIGTPCEKVRERLGVPDIVVEDRWQYRYQNTQVEIAFTKDLSVQTLVIALLFGEKYHGSDAPFGDFVLGEITVQDLIDMGHKVLSHRESMLTKELVVPVQVGPAGAWSECFFGALVVYTGVGNLADTNFDWNGDTEQLRSQAAETTLNWVGIGQAALEAPYFDWNIKA